jgi:hypothetical protein
MSLDRIVKDLEPAHTVPPMEDGWRELFDEITATPRREPMPVRRRLRFTAPLVAGLAAVAMVASWLLPNVGGLGPEHASALDIKKENGYYIVTVKDLFADPERYQKQLRDFGLDISLKVDPVSPGLVGIIFTPYDPRLNGLSPAEQARRDDVIHPIEEPGNCARVTRCTIGLRIPMDYRPYKGPESRGPATISLGREARPGERHVGFGPLNNPGEPLQCQKFTNKSVGEVRAMLRERGVAVGTYAVPLRGSRSWVPDSWYVHEGWLSEPGKALLVADDKPRTGPPPPSMPCPGG